MANGDPVSGGKDLDCWLPGAPDASIVQSFPVKESSYALTPDLYSCGFESIVPNFVFFHERTITFNVSRCVIIFE